MPRTSRELPDHRSKKRPSYSPASHHRSWVILNERCSRGGDSNDGDRTMAVTSTGEHIGVSVELKEPPNISFLTVFLPDRLRKKTDTTESIVGNVNVIAAHRDIVLLKANFRSGLSFDDRPIDYFIYRASRDPYQGPSMSLLPVSISQHYMMKNRTGILSSGNSDKDNSFVVADLWGRYPQSMDPCYLNCGQRQIDLNVLWPGSGNKWTVFNNVHVRHANGGRDLDWWTTDAVVPYRSRYLIWVDYYRGAIFADLAHPKKQPDLWYVPLPVNPPPGDPDDDHDRGLPEASRSLCVTRSGIKFVSVDHQRSTNYGVGHWEWTHTFRITTWSLCDDGVTWRRDARLYAAELWALDSKNHLPRVAPSFPVVNMENPNVVSFAVEENHYVRGSSARACMVEIDMRKKALLAVTDYSKDEERILFGVHSTKFATDLPRYAYAGEACKQRRQE